MVHGFSDSDKGKKPMNMFYDFSDGKVYAYDNNEVLQEVNLGGGGSSPKLNYDTPLHTFSSGNLTYTASKDCYLSGALVGGGTITIDGLIISINNVYYSGNSNAAWTYGRENNIKDRLIPSGSTVTVSAASDHLYILEAQS